MLVRPIPLHVTNCPIGPSAHDAVPRPGSAALRKRDQQASSGTLEIAPIEAPLSLFVWSRHRIIPVRVTQLTIAEEAFDPNLNPIRAKVSIAMRSLSIDDFGFSHRGGGLFMAYLTAQEALAKNADTDNEELLAV